MFSRLFFCWHLNFDFDSTPASTTRALDFGAKFQIVAFRMLMGNGSPRITVNSVFDICVSFNGLQFNFMHRNWKVREFVNVCLVEKNSCSLKWYVPHVPRLECNGHYSHVNPTALKDLHNNNTLPSVVPESQERWLFIPSIRYLELLQLLTTTE